MIDLEKNIRIMYFAVDTLTGLLIDLIYNFDITNRILMDLYIRD
jgi:hypothetical protein